MFNQIGGLNAMGAPMSPHQIGGENFIRHIGNDKLILDFHEGSGTTVYDKSHNGNNGTFGAGVKAPTWKRNSLYFDGGQYIDLAANFLAKSDFINGGSVLVVCKFSAGATAKIIDIEGAWMFHFNTSGNICSSIDGSSGLPSSISSLNYGDNCRYCIIVTWDKETGATVKNIIDGVEDGISTQDLYDIDGLNRTTCIGSMYGGTQRFYTGGMKMVRILNKCLSGIECQQEYLVNNFSNN